MATDTLYVTRLICGSFEHIFANGKATKDFNIEGEIALFGITYKINEIIYQIEENETECIICTTYIVEKVV